MEPWVASLQSASGSDPHAVVFEALALLSHSTNTTAASAVNGRTNPDAAILKASLIGQHAESIVTSTCRSIVAAAWWSSREAVAAISCDVELMDELLDRRGTTGQQQQPAVTPLTVAVAALRHLREGAPAQLLAETIPSELTLAATSSLKHLLGLVVDTAQTSAHSVTVSIKKGSAQKAPNNDSTSKGDLFSGRSKTNICTRHPLRCIARITMAVRGSANAAGASQESGVRGGGVRSQRMIAAITDALLNATEVAQTAATTQGTSSSASLPTRDAIGNFHKLLARLLDSIGNAQSMAVKSALLQTIVTYLQYCSVLLTESVLSLITEDICEDVAVVTAKNRRAQKRNALFKKSQTNEQNKGNNQEGEAKNLGSKRLLGLDHDVAVASPLEGISNDESEDDYIGENEEQHEDPLLIAQIWHELSIEVSRLLLPPQWLSDTLRLLPEAALTLAYDAHNRHQQTCLDDASASGPALTTASSPPPHATGLSGGTYSTGEQALHLPVPVLTALRNSLSFSSLANTDGSLVLSYANHSTLAETALECMDSLLVEPTAEATGHFSLLGVGGSGGGVAASPAALVGSDAAVFGLKLSPQCAHDFLFSCRQLHPCLRYALSSLMSVNAQQRAANATTVLLWDHIVRSHIDHGHIYENSADSGEITYEDCTYLEEEDEGEAGREKKGMILGAYRSVGEALAAEGIAPLASDEASRRAAPYVFYDEPPALLPVAGCHYVISGGGNNNSTINQQSLPTLQQSHNTSSSAAHFYSVRGAGVNPSLASMSVAASPPALLTPPHHGSGGGGIAALQQQQTTTTTTASSSFQPSSSLLKRKPSGLLGNSNNSYSTSALASSPQPKRAGAAGVQQKETVSDTAGAHKKNKKSNKKKNRAVSRCVSLDPIAVAVAQLDSVFSTWGSSAVSNGNENCRTIVAEDLFFEAVRACLTEVDEKNKSLALRLVAALDDLNSSEKKIESNKSNNIGPQQARRPPTSAARPLNVSTKKHMGGGGMVYSSGDSSSSSSSSGDDGDSESSRSSEEESDAGNKNSRRRRRQSPIASLLTEVVEYLAARENTDTLLLQAAVGSPKIYLALASTANFRTSSVAMSLASAGDKRLSAVLGWECPRLMHARWSLLPAICQAMADRHEAFRTVVTLLSDALKKLGEAKKEMSSVNRKDGADEDSAEEAERLAYESMRKVLQQQREFDTNVILPLPVALLKFLDRHWNSMPTLRQIKEVLAAEWIVTDEAKLLDLMMGPRTSSGHGADLINLLTDITFEASAKVDTQKAHHRDPTNSQSLSPSGSPLRLLNSRSNTSFSFFSSCSSMSPSFAYSPSPTGRMIRAQTASGGLLLEDGRGSGGFTGATSLGGRKGGVMSAAGSPSSPLIEPFLYQFDADGLRDDGGARRRAARGGGGGGGFGVSSPQSGKPVGTPSAAAISELLQTIQTSNSSGAVVAAALVLLTSSFASSSSSGSRENPSSSSVATRSQPSVSRLSSVLSAVTAGFSKSKARQALSSITSIASFITVHSSPSAAIRIINAAESLLSSSSSSSGARQNILAFDSNANNNKNDVEEEAASQQRLLNALYQISAHLASTAPPGHLVAFFPLLLKTFQSLSVAATEMAAESEHMMKQIESSYAKEVEELRSMARSLVKVARQLATHSKGSSPALKEEELRKTKSLQTKYEELFAAICGKRRTLSAMKKRFVGIRNQDAARQCVVYLESTRALRELLHHLAFRVTELPNNWLTGNALLQCVASYLASTTAPDVLMRREADLAAKTSTRTHAEDLMGINGEDTDDGDTEDDENSDSESDDGCDPQLNTNEKAAKLKDEGLIDSDCDGVDGGCPELKNALRCIKAISSFPTSPFVSRNHIEKSIGPVPAYKKKDDRGSDLKAPSPKIPASIVSRCSAELALTAPTAESFLKAMAKHFSSPAVGEHTAVILTLLHHLPTRKVSSMLQVDAAADTADTLNFCERRTMHSAVLPSVKPFTITAVLGESLRRRIMPDGSIPEEDSQTLAATSVASYTEQTDLCLKISLEVTDPTIPESVPELAAGIIHIYSTTPGVVLSTVGVASTASPLGSSLAESASSPQRSIAAGPTPPSVSAAGFVMANTMGSSSASFNSSHANNGGVFLAMPLCGNKVRLPSADGPAVISTEESQRITAAPVVRLCPPITTIIRVTDPRPITLAANFIGADGKEVPLCIRTRREQTTATLASMGYTLQSSREAHKSINKSPASLTRAVNPTLTLEAARYVYAVSRTQPLASSSGSAPSASTVLADLIHSTQREVPIEFALRLAAALQSRATFCLQRNASSAFRGGVVGSLSSGAARGAKASSLSSSSLAPHSPTGATAQQLDPQLFFVYVCPGDVVAVQIAPVYSTAARVGCAAGGHNSAAARLIADLEGYLSSSSDDDDKDEDEGTCKNLKQSDDVLSEQQHSSKIISSRERASVHVFSGKNFLLGLADRILDEFVAEL